MSNEDWVHWDIFADADNPDDQRIKNGKYMKEKSNAKLEVVEDVQ